LSVDEKANVQGVSDSLMSLSGAFGGAVAGSIVTAFAFSGVNAAALIPAVLIIIASGLATARAKKIA
jgi:hypothetical protein